MTRFDVLEGKQQGKDHGTDEGGDSGSGSAIAVVGGGHLVGEIVDKLWALGWQTTTGICECVSFAGPALGGGHGVLQGQYGLAADQIVGARVVLANGEVVEVSEKRNKDLFWALKGAGHNFGVVSEFRVRLHRVEEQRREWAYEAFVFTQEKLEEVYALAERLADEQPADVIYMSLWAKVPAVDPVKVSWLPLQVLNDGDGKLTAAARHQVHGSL
jgi:FAD/FMN-containing dehydrogenase